MAISADMSLSSIFTHIYRACNDFTNPLYKSLSANTDKNIIISPLSLHMLLSLLSNGAGGSTLNELRSALGYDKESLNQEYKDLIVLLSDIKNVTLHIANAAYVQKGVDLTGDFLSICMNIFDSSISKIDFENSIHAADIINSWVRTATNNNIFNIISPGDTNIDTKIMLLNAIYFKSRWLTTFNEKDTVKREFHVSKTETYLVPTMFKKATYFYGEIPDWNTRFIEIPYLNKDIVMIILLPDKEIELHDLENNFNWQTLVETHRFSDDFELYLPKFKLELTINLKDVLHKMGLNMMFEDDADFTRLSKYPLKVSSVLQKIFIEVNEQGSEAAAVTVAEVRLKRMVILPMEFIVDRPFMFAIMYKPIRVPLFVGRVCDLDSFSSVKDEL
ncbi:unnamed protein product [Lasius platythorax]